jgi:hypothetical protein
MNAQTNRRRWYQFSLRVLLVLITVTALLALYWRERTLRVRAEKMIREYGYLEARNQERLKRSVGRGWGLGAPRAFTISTPSSPEDGTDFLWPHNHVDVLLTAKMDSGGQFTTTLLQDIVILARGSQLHTTKDSSGKTSRYRNVTLLVPLEGAARLAHAQSVGTLHLTLRSDNDNASVDTNIIHQHQLLKEHPAR